MAATTLNAFVYLNGNSISRNDKRSAQQLLKTLPKGAYTSLRVEKLRNVLDWTFHLNRLNKSVQLLAENAPDSYPRVQRLGFSSTSLERKVAKSLKEALLDMESETVISEERSDQLVVLLITPAKDDDVDPVGDVYAHIRHAPGIGSVARPIQVWVQGEGRSLPEAKYSKWITDRIPLEEQKPSDCQEVVLRNDQGGLLEGLTSSFYVIKRTGSGDVLQTAGLHDGILAGTFRHVLLQALKASSLPLTINETCPLLSETSSWTEAFISNSLTGIRPIGRIVIASGDGDVVFKEVPGPYTMELMRMTSAMHERTAIEDL